MLDSGARITLGSDFPVETVNPLAGFYAAITRIGSDGTSPHGPNGWCVYNSISSFPYPRYPIQMGAELTKIPVRKTDRRFPDQCLTRKEALRG